MGPSTLWKAGAEVGRVKRTEMSIRFGAYMSAVKASWETRSDKEHAIYCQSVTRTVGWYAIGKKEV